MNKNALGDCRSALAAHQRRRKRLMVFWQSPLPRSISGLTRTAGVLLVSAARA
jgi:hypothetical protein